MRVRVFLGFMVCLFLSGGCAGPSEDLVVFSGRGPAIYKQLVKQFEEDTGLRVKMVHLLPPELLEAVATTGSVADVIWVKETFSLAPLAEGNYLAPLPADLYHDVDARFVPQDPRWARVTARSNTLAYSTRVDSTTLPESVLDLALPRWKGRVGWNPGNTSFLGMVSAVRSLHGEEVAESWLRDMIENQAVFWDSNSAMLRGLERGEVDVAFTEHQKALLALWRRPDLGMGLHAFRQGDAGNLISYSGAAVLAAAGHPENAERFVRYLMSLPGQQHLTNISYEYPGLEGTACFEVMEPFEALFERAPRVKEVDGASLEGARKLLVKLGLMVENQQETP